MLVINETEAQNPITIIRRRRHNGLTEPRPTGPDDPRSFTKSLSPHADGKVRMGMDQNDCLKSPEESAALCIAVEPRRD